MPVNCHNCAGEIQPHEARHIKGTKVFCSLFCRRQDEIENAPVLKVRILPDLRWLTDGQKLKCS